MRCPFCGYEESKVTDSRSSVDLNSIRRRRECLKCEERFTTFETIDLTIQVRKKDGTYEDFKQEKLLKGLDNACCHSKVSHDQVRILVSKIIASLMSRQIREISTKELGDIVMDHLKALDMVAYIRFACVYRRFKDIDEVVGAIQSVKPTAEKEELNAIKN
jgi:transcriptional repressor NrdR